ncbi:MAG TPA: serine/threonine-protein kinase, partial [Planctomycetota bacterium]|nr:serine/threonine-protein kinase [Planctomycetota bacterium]
MAVPFVKAGLFEEFEVHEDRVIHKDESGVLCRGCRRSEGGAVAIKIMHPGSVIPERLLRIARKEAGIFEHQPDEHVLSVVGTGLWKGRTFYALEDVQGESLLKQLQAGRRFTTDEILHIGEGVGRALKAAWAAGCVHGAIRPAHVFLTPAGNVKLIGFGLPRNLEQNTGSPGGLSALRYLAPEQVRSEPLNVQSDLYSLGIVLYELATGKTPFDGFESSTSLLYQVSYVDPAPPRSAGSLIAPDLERLILRCLEKRREQRMTSPEAFLGDIEAVRNSARTSEPSPLDDDRGDFEIFPDQTIGEGGMGTLYRGRQISLDRPVAIKVIRGILTSSPDYVQRFRREAELLAQVNDPSIVQVFGTGTWKGRVFYAMELVEGKDLAVLLEQKGRLVVDEILDIGEGVAQALKAAWAYKIVHRDIKPSNILVTPDRRVKVADFGLAKSLRVPRRDSQLIAGTSEYISPEQAMGLSVDIRADLYSLGVVMYELASGRPPFTTEESFTGLVYHHVHTPPAHLSTMAPDLPEPLMTLIHG